MAASEEDAGESALGDDMFAALIWGEDQDEMTPMMLASADGDLKKLAALAGGSDVNEVDKNGKTPLMYAVLAVKASRGWGTSKNDLENLAKAGLVTRALLSAGADPNAKADGGTTALMVAAWRGNTAAVADLVEAGADIMARDERGATAVAIARTAGEDAAADLLIRMRTALREKEALDGATGDAGGGGVRRRGL